MALKTKKAFITGGAQGLGRGYMEALLSNGARVVFGDINPQTGAATEEEMRQTYGQDSAKFIEFDVTNGSQFEAAFQEAVSFLGHVDLMVNNAGIMRENVWERMIELNYTAVVRGTKIANEHMRKDKGGQGGRIINCSSIMGLEDSCHVPVYCGLKQAVRSYTVSMSKAPDLKDQGVEFGVICPGAADTDLVAQMNSTTICYIDRLAKEGQRVDLSTASVPRIAEGFLKLVTLEEMNGAILMVDHKEMTFYTMESRALGPNWPATPTAKADQ